MVLQDWTLGTLLQDLRTEFGLADTGEANTALASAINKAQAWVVRRRPNWPWLRKEHLIDVPVATSATVTVTQGSRTVVSTSLPTVRDVFVAGESLADGTDGYLVTAVGAGSFTLQSQYRSANATGASCTFQKGWFQLPDDFLRLESIYRMYDITGERVYYKSPAEFERIRAQAFGAGIRETLFTVTNDPLSLTHSRFLAVYPFIAGQTTFKLVYWKDVPSLIGYSDVPTIPRNDRPVLFNFAAWFYAQSQGKDTTEFYRDLALQALRDMEKEYDYVDTVENDEDPGYRGEWVPLPPEYPELY